jgi:uridylate kinase
MQSKKQVVLKLSGEVFDTRQRIDGHLLIDHIVQQLHVLMNTYSIGIVVGGGNFFRGDAESKAFAVRRSTADAVGMLATIMNGLLLQDLCEQNGIATTLFSTQACPSFAQTLMPDAVTKARAAGHLIIFSGGSGNPFITTDTTAVLRALELQAQEIWKGTKVDGVYSADPLQHPNAQRFAHITYEQVRAHDIAIMDRTAFSLAYEHAQSIRIFNIFVKDALIQAAQNKQFGSLVTVQ